ncbi:hypothetical protein BD414DRAFT_495390 [Trametes punicea]|nr:hypothetical protein BD414DRAFT_495390 [Trametes punicea]
MLMLLDFLHIAYRYMTMAAPAAFQERNQIANDVPDFTETPSTESGMVSPQASESLQAGGMQDVAKAAPEAAPGESERKTAQRREEQETRARVDQLQRELHEARAEHQRYAGELERAVAGRQAIKERASQMQTELRQACAKISDLEHELAASKNALQNTASLLETRSAELRDAQAFLTKVDDVSDSEVLNLVEQLNSSVFQTSASIANAFRAGYGRIEEGEGIEQTYATLASSGLVPPDMLSALRCLDHTQDSIVVQTALQGTITSYTRWLCDTWDFRVGDQPSLLQYIYRRMREHEPQSVGGRWRALSRRYTKAVIGLDETQQIASQILAEHVVTVLLACGVAGAERDILHVVNRRFSRAFSDIAGFALEFQRLTGECVVSRDLIVVTAEAGIAFDASRMIDEWGNPKDMRSSTAAGTVLCTTQLGLVREQGSIGRAGVAAERVQCSILLKPTVVLTTMLEEMWTEQIPSQTTKESSRSRKIEPSINAQEAAECAGPKYMASRELV